jgi:hypothetical protein
MLREFPLNLSALVVVTCLPLDPRLAASNPAGSDAFLMTIKFVAVLDSEGK